MSEDKTEWAAELTVFLGVLLNGRSMSLGVPEEKRIRAVQMLQNLIDKHKVPVNLAYHLCKNLDYALAYPVWQSYEP